MPKRSYSIQSQRLVRGAGYVSCAPHQACRVIVVETTTVPAKLGRRTYHIKRTVGNFSGPGALNRARLECDRLTGRTQPKAVDRDGRGKPLWGRSCTIAEYDSIMNKTREEGSY